MSVKDGRIVLAPRWDREVRRLSELVPSIEITDLDRCKAHGFVPLRSPTGAVIRHATGVLRPDLAKSCPAIWRATCAGDATFRAEHPEGCQRAQQSGI